MGNPIVADAYGLDRAAAALFCGAKAGETISLMMARGAVSGRLWPCLACRVLDWAVERGHCARVLAGDPTPILSKIRAAVLLFAAAAVVEFAPFGLWLIFCGGK